MWLYNLIIGTGLLITLYFSNNNQNSILPVFLFPVFLFLTWIFTINSYQESVKSQSMQMYHLIPISGNTKFISKQLITLIAYPLILTLITALIIGIVRILIDAPDAANLIDHPSKASVKNSMTGLNLILFWIFGHALSTFFAIIFRKNKILYALLVYFGFQFSLSIIMIIYVKTLNLKNGDKVPGFLDKLNLGDWIGAVFIIGSAVLYSISYNKFFRRQL